MADRLPPPMPGPLPSSFDDNADFYNERPMQKVARKLREEPLIPLGAGLTVFAFVNAYRALRRGDSQQANRMFRARVLAQGFTVVAMVAGSMYYSKDREKTKELRKLKEERDAEEKTRRWIRELEVRDDEEKALREALKKRAQGGAQKNENSEGEGEAPAEKKGGVLAGMGLWSKGEQKAKEAAEAAEKVKDQVEEKVRNPKSSLGDLGEIMGQKRESKNKDDSGKR